MRSRLLALGVGVVLAGSGAGVRAQQWSGRVSAETRAFLVAADEPDQPRATLSVSAEPEFFAAWGRNQSILAVPFGRVDPADAARTHVDVRELVWRLAGNRWDLRAGVGKVFWGVTESQHLVDVVNQTDFVENIDGEDKLGQPMIDLALTQGWGTLEGFVLPGFRKRTYPGLDGRLRFPLRVDADLSEFAAASGARHVDVAVRWSRALGRWDLGASHFRGTSREPWFRLRTGDEGEPILVPRYELIDQTGLDLQATAGGWLWKLEAITRGGQGDRFGQGGRFTALTGGFEYTMANVRGSGRDAGLLLEYLFDDRGRAATTPFEDDVFVGTRLELNDPQTTRLLAGGVIDRKTGATFFSVEGSRRLGERWALAFEVRAFAGLQPDDYIYSFRHDHYVQLEVSRYF